METETGSNTVPPAPKKEKGLVKALTYPSTKPHSHTATANSAVDSAARKPAMFGLDARMASLAARDSASAAGLPSSSARAEPFA